ncbi:hypothetical protein [Streptomyces sp. MJP52]|uniref:hypothetical protein n=1 Tax=Streptomyces sp. MJP52 TaxID=2940555 RepID=UPI00247D0F78|nr:hypothetical protein [Streptomyces sp. MJP52]
MVRSRLAPGVEVVPVPGRGLAVRTEGGEFLGVKAGAVDHDALLSLLSGRTGTPADAGLDRLLRAFEEAGYLTGPSQDQAAPQWPAARRAVRAAGRPGPHGTARRLPGRPGRRAQDRPGARRLRGFPAHPRRPAA